MFSKELLKMKALTEVVRFRSLKGLKNVFSVGDLKRGLQLPLELSAAKIHDYLNNVFDGFAVFQRHEDHFSVNFVCLFFRILLF